MRFVEGKIIDEIDVKGKKFIFRYPSRKDAKLLMNAYNKAVKETHFLSARNPVKFKKEMEWLLDEIRKIKIKKDIMIFAEHDNKIIGNCGIHRFDYDAGKYTAEFGIFLLKKYWGLGLGKRLSDLCINQAKNNTNIRTLTSNIYEGNERSLAIHKKLGFKICGKIPKCIEYKGKMKTKIILYKVLK